MKRKSRKKDDIESFMDMVEAQFEEYKTTGSPDDEYTVTFSLDEVCIKCNGSILKRFRNPYDEQTDKF